jgi:hypothetical protein
MGQEGAASGPLEILDKRKHRLRDSAKHLASSLLAPTEGGLRSAQRQTTGGEKVSGSQV